jgi:hypothetical protein
LHYQTKSAENQRFLFDSGERGIRTPGPVTVNGFQDRRIRPLCHLSGAKIGAGALNSKKKMPPKGSIVA